jgi:hypothetical protein
MKTSRNTANEDFKLMSKYKSLDSFPINEIISQIQQ